MYMKIMIFEFTKCLRSIIALLIYQLSCARSKHNLVCRRGNNLPLRVERFIGFANKMAEKQWIEQTTLEYQLKINKTDSHMSIHF